MPSAPPFSTCLDPAPFCWVWENSSPIHSLMSSNYSLHGLPLLDSPSIVQTSAPSPACCSSSCICVQTSLVSFPWCFPASHALFCALLHSYFFAPIIFSKNYSSNRFIWISSWSQVQNWKESIINFYNWWKTSEKRLGKRDEKWEGVKGPLSIWHGTSRGLNPALKILNLRSEIFWVQYTHPRIPDNQCLYGVYECIQCMICINAYMHVCMYACVYVCTHVCRHVGTFIVCIPLYILCRQVYNRQRVSCLF